MDRGLEVTGSASRIFIQNGAFQNSHDASACCDRSPEVPNHIGKPQCRSPRGIITRAFANPGCVYGVDSTLSGVPNAARSAGSASVHDRYASGSFGSARSIRVAVDATAAALHARSASGPNVRTTVGWVSATSR